VNPQISHTFMPTKIAQLWNSGKTLRFRILSAPARLVTHARRRTLKIPPGWRWASDIADAFDRLQALHPVCSDPNPDDQGVVDHRE
jgi:hypothetical protein